MADKNSLTSGRHPKENQLIQKAQEVLVRKKFNAVDELKSAVYASLVRYLEEKEIIRTGPFDATLHRTATLQNIDEEKLKSSAHLNPCQSLACRTTLPVWVY